MLDNLDDCMLKVIDEMYLVIELSLLRTWLMKFANELGEICEI